MIRIKRHQGKASDKGVTSSAGPATSCFLNPPNPEEIAEPMLCCALIALFAGQPLVLWAAIKARVVQNSYIAGIVAHHRAATAVALSLSAAGFIFAGGVLGMSAYAQAPESAGSNTVLHGVICSVFRQ
ncbi:MAG TPA: hypothetical protein VHL34_14230 [Rhizomicrobium sp.]|nr:hypothetical protein [Rhizomicrobium sp.]